MTDVVLSALEGFRIRFAGRPLLVWLGAYVSTGSASSPPGLVAMGYGTPTFYQLEAS